MSAFGVFPAHYTSFTYAEYNNWLTNQLYNLKREDLDSAGNATRDMDVVDARGFEENQVLLRENQAHIAENSLAAVQIKNMVSDIEVFEGMARDFQKSLTEIRTSTPYPNPAFLQNITDNLQNLARILNKSSNGFYPYGFSTGNSTVVDQTIMTTALPAGATQDFSYLFADPNGTLTYRSSSTLVVELDGVTFHTVMEEFIRAQRMALSGNIGLSDRTQDPSLTAASNLMSQALDDFQGLLFSFAQAAGKFDKETEAIKDENIRLATAIQILGYKDPRETFQEQFDMAQTLRTQDSTYVMATKQTERLVEKLESLSR